MQQQSLITLIKGDKVDSKTDYRDALPVNMYAVRRPILGADGYMIQQQGLSKFSVGSGIDRGGFWNDRQRLHFRVSGNSLITVASNGTIATIGTISGANNASMDCSFNTQAVCADGKFWLYDAANGLRQVTDPDLGAPIDFCWVDGYYFFTDGEYIYHTDITDESIIDPLKFATAEFIPDYTYGVAKTEDNKVMVFGRYSIEYFVNQAAENFAFTRVPSRALKIGIVGTYAKCEVAGKYYILGSRKEEAVSFHRIGVGQAEKLASREVDQILQNYSDDQLEDVVLESFESDGTTFILIHLPDHVLMFNQTIAVVAGVDQAWSTWKSDVSGSAPCRAKHGVFDKRINKWIFGDKIGSTIGLLDASVATQYGNIVEWELYTPFMYLEDMSIDELEIETIPGFTTTLDATVFVSMTYDGITYSNEWVQMYGLPSQYMSRFIVRRLGYIDNWLGFKLRGATRSRMAFGKGTIKYG
jgi:hypothetical protein